MTRMKIYPTLILEALRQVRYPGSGQDIVSLGMVCDDIRIDGRKVSLSLQFPRETDPFARSVVRASEAAIETQIGEDVEIRGNIAIKARPKAEKPAERPLSGVKNIVGVSSGKGGVGKSTVACNLAVSLASQSPLF